MLSLIIIIFTVQLGQQGDRLLVTIIIFVSPCCLQVLRTPLARARQGNAAVVYLAFQAAAYVALAVLIMRLKCLMTPLLVVFAAMLVSPRVKHQLACKHHWRYQSTSVRLWALSSTGSSQATPS